MDSLAEPLRSRVCDEALVAAPELLAELETLIARCRLRDDLTAGLGASATTRYRSGVRALFTGPSGTGKTLAAGWIATRLGLPLYRVDLASVTSKYIGETEKNLSQLLARAEQAEVVLFFDEADSLFGKRTDIKDSNDRFANAQTNYLLQRIETYDGIVLLTSNSQARFDSAFARRLDFIIDFPAARAGRAPRALAIASRSAQRHCPRRVEPARGARGLQRRPHSQCRARRRRARAPRAARDFAFGRRDRDRRRIAQARPAGAGRFAGSTR